MSRDYTDMDIKDIKIKLTNDDGATAEIEFGIWNGRKTLGAIVYWSNQEDCDYVYKIENAKGDADFFVNFLQKIEKKTKLKFYENI